MKGSDKMKGIKKIFAEFKEFISRGNVLDMAVGVVIATAFTGVVNSVVKGLVTPIVGLFMPNTTFADWAPGGFAIGEVLNSIISFLITAAVIFAIVKLVNTAQNLAKRKEEVVEEVTTKTCPYCLSEIPIAATRCAHCTSVLKEAPAEEAE